MAFLERHGRYRLAAEMAEARDLPPGLVVRQWFLAGDRERALRIARRTGAFADAVTRLERSRQPEQARELRRLWAHGLAEAGDYAAAVDAALAARRRAPPRPRLDGPAPSSRGELPAGRMLARKVALAPEPFAPGARRLPDAARELARRGGRRPPAPSPTPCAGARARRRPQALARAAVRAIARDSGRLGARMAPAEFRQLVDLRRRRRPAGRRPGPRRCRRGRPGSRATALWRVEIDRAGTPAPWPPTTPPSCPTA